MSTHQSVTTRVGLAEAKNKLSALTTEANLSGAPFIILKNNLPWVEVRPLAPRVSSQDDRIVVRPLKRDVRIPDIDDLFADYDGDYVPEEDSLAKPSGNEEL